MKYHLMDYVGSPTIISKTIKTAATQAETKQGQAAMRMLKKRDFRNFRNQLRLQGVNQ